MLSRRHFLQSAGAATFLFARRQVRVGGRPVRTIDIHAHVAIPEAAALHGVTAPDDALVFTPARFKTMDEWGIDMQALSINPNWYAAERDVAAQVIKLQNEKLAELCARYPDRLVALASVALQFPDLAAEQLEEGVKKYNLRGAAIGGHVDGDELSAGKFDPFWSKAEQLGVLIFIHPQGIPEIDKRLAGNGGLTNVIGNPLETTIALSHLIFDGTLDRFPNLKICAAHGGGYLPSYAGRSDYGCVRFPDVQGGKEKAVGVFAAALFRFDGFYGGGPAAHGRRMRRQPDHDRHRLSLSVEHDYGRSCPDHAGIERCAEAGDAGRERG